MGSSTNIKSLGVGRRIACVRAGIRVGKSHGFGWKRARVRAVVRPLASAGKMAHDKVVLRAILRVIESLSVGREIPRVKAVLQS